MRVISGLARGHKLFTYKGKDIRPTSDKVRESLFNILGPEVFGSFFLDLFAGSGAVGIEALSRGAVKAIFVDKDNKSKACIVKNLSKTRFHEKGEVFRGDVIDVLFSLNQKGHKYDYIFLDPPYKSDIISRVLSIVNDSELLKEEGIVIVEHSADNQNWLESANLIPIKNKCYGDTVLTFLKKV